MNTCQTTNVPDRLLTTSEVASWLGVKSKTILMWVRSGKMPVCRIGQRTIRFEPDAVLRALREVAQ